MEGVTEPCFRDLVLSRNQPEHLGGTLTEFVRVHATPVPRAIVRRHIGPSRHPQPVGVQLMGNDLERLAATALRAAEQGGAAMLTVHCRTRAEAYCPEVDWTRIARAASAVSIPVCGNGGVESHADFERLRRETGARFAMVGRGALADPWIFSGRSVTRGEAARFLVDYADLMRERNQWPGGGIAARVKQLLRYWTAGGLVESEEHRLEWLREKDGTALLGRLRALAAQA